MQLPTKSFRERIYATTPGTFGAHALEVFALQRAHNPTYRRWLELSHQTAVEPQHWRQIPCLPISLFRGHELRTGHWTPEATFRSSGTTGDRTSEMPVRSLDGYRRHCLAAFRALVADPAEYTLLALLPGYLERGDSGLVAMVDHFVARSQTDSGFFLDDTEGLRAAVAKTTARGGRVLLWGVTHALLGLAEGAPLVLPKGSLIVETGGMKGRGPELTRGQLHERLDAAFGVPIYSEYGMTELSSQAYLTAGPHFRPAPTLRVVARDLTDPATLLNPGGQGALNLVDLANVDTCAFVQSEDLGRVHADGTFDVLGRVDRSVARGCNLLV